MENAKVEATKFNSSDVIATSLHIDEVEMNSGIVPVIWLDKTSLFNYNNFNDDDTNISYTDEHNYFAVSRAVGTNHKYVVKPSNDKPTKLNKMSENDETIYNLIFAWLNQGR